MKCCKGNIHTACLGSILEKGFNKCPQCQREMYPQQEQVVIPPPQPMFYVPVHQPHPCTDKTLKGIGVGVLFVLGFGLLSNIIL